MNIELPSTPRKVGDQPHVLISYSYGDREFARKLAGALRRDKVTPWIDEVEMSAGVFLVSRISQAARPVDFIVPVLSGVSVPSDWVQRELKAATTREFNARRVIVLPARIDNCVLPDYLTSQFCVDFHSLGWNRAYENIKAGIQRRPGTRPATPPAPVVQPPPPGARVPDTDEKAAGTKRVFLCYDYDNDGNYKDILVTWSKHPDFAHFSVNDQPVTIPVDSEEAEPIKRIIAAKIGAATGFLCVVGTKTGASGWMEWEIKKADELGKRIIAVRIARDCTAPEVLSDVGATCALSFTFEGIRRAIDEAYGGCSLE
jgi:hypothetical protein